MSMKKMMMVAAIAVSATGMSGCGMGKKLVKSLQFAAGDENGHLLAGFDAKVEMGMGALPDVKLPIYDPKNPAKFLGYVETLYDGTISVRIDVTSAAKVRVTDGTKLPNGREIPVALPPEVVPIAIPVINSSSKVYLAVGAQNIMAGVAVTLLADTSTGNSEWLRILRSLPTNIFYPYQIDANLKGAAGLFTGEKVGVGVFAVKGLSKPEKDLVFEDVTFASTDFAASRLAARQGYRPAAAAAAPRTEFFGVKTQYPVGSKMNKIQRALGKVRDTRLD